MQVLVNQAETTAAYPLTTTGTDGTSENCRYDTLPTKPPECETSTLLH